MGFSVAILTITLFASNPIDNYDPVLFVAIIGVFAIAGLIVGICLSVMKV